MITIEYAKNGKTYSDFEVEKFANEYCVIYSETKKDTTYVVSNENIVDAMKLMVAEGKISNEHLQFKFEDELINVNNKGEIEKYPIGFCDYTTNILFKLFKLRKLNKDI
jgi:hypothetical protein